MTRRVGDIIIIEHEPEQQCDECGQIAELRPYGPPGKTLICHDCMMKDEPAARERFFQIMGLLRQDGT